MNPEGVPRESAKEIETIGMKGYKTLSEYIEQRISE